VAICNTLDRCFHIVFADIATAAMHTAHERRAVVARRCSCPHVKPHIHRITNEHIAYGTHGQPIHVRTARACVGHF
jgi:hypothetical protein